MNGFECGLMKFVLGSSQFIQITQAEFDSLLDAKEGLLAALEFEQKFDWVVENYLSWERALLDSACVLTYTSGQDWEWFQQNRALLERLVANLFSSCRAYFDQMSHELATHFGRASPQFDAFKRTRAKEYDARTGYRICEGLRNHLQHRASIIAEVAYSGSRIEHRGRAGDEKQVLAQMVVVPKISCQAIEEGGGFKPAVLSELKGMGEKTDLRLLVRDYVDGVRAVHCQMRGLLKPSVEEWTEVITAAIQRFRSAYESSAGLAVVKRDSERRIVQRADVFDDIIKLRIRLEAKNRDAMFSNRYCSGTPCPEPRTIPDE